MPYATHRCRVSCRIDIRARAPPTQALGKRHVPYGVLPAHYDVVGQALLATLEGGLGAEWNDQARRPQSVHPLCDQHGSCPTTLLRLIPYDSPTAAAGEGLVDGGVRHHRQDDDRRQLPRGLASSAGQAPPPRQAASTTHLLSPGVSSRNTAEVQGCGIYHAAMYLFICLQRACTLFFT